jgi:hypothetical protein
VRSIVPTRLDMRRSTTIHRSLRASARCVDAAVRGAPTGAATHAHRIAIAHGIRRAGVKDAEGTSWKSA